MRAVFKSGLGLLLTALVLSGCGFHLRSVLSMPPQRLPVVVMAEDAAGLAAQLTQTLRQQGVTVVAAAQRPQAKTVVYLRNQRVNQRVLTVSGTNAQAAELELNYRVNLEVQAADGSVLLAEQRLELSRDFTYDDTAVLAKGTEQQVVQEELEADMLAQIIRILRAVVAKEP